MQGVKYIICMAAKKEDKRSVVLTEQKMVQAGLPDKHDKIVFIIDIQRAKHCHCDWVNGWLW